jgi:hypothetical protein
MMNGFEVPNLVDYYLPSLLLELLKGGKVVLPGIY